MNQSDFPRKSSYKGPRNKRLAQQKKRKKQKIMFASVGAAAVVALTAAVIFWPEKENKEAEAFVTEAQSTEAPLRDPVTVDGISLEGMSREEAKKTLMEKYPWNLQVAREGKDGKETLTIANMVEPEIDKLLDEIFTSKEGGDYILEINGEKEAIEAEAAAVARAWDVKPQNTKLDHFDNHTGKFIFTEGKS